MQDTKEKPITFEYAMSEKTAKENEADLKRKEEERRALEEETAKKLAELKAQQDQEKAEQEKIRLQMQKEYEEMLAKMKAEIDAKKDDEEAKREAEEREAKMRLEMEFKLEQDKLAAQKAEADRQERIRKETIALQKRQQEFTALEAKLGDLLPKVNEANQIAAELKRDIRFNARMHREIATRSEDIGSATTEIIVKVDNNEDGYFYPWNPNKFEDRLEMMRQLLNDYFETNEIPDFRDKDKDPFWDPP